MFFDFFKKKLEDPEVENEWNWSDNPEGLKKSKVRVVRTRSMGVLPNIKPDGKKAAVIGASKEHPYWRKNGWMKIGKVYQGYFVATQGAWMGHIEEDFQGSFSFYIFHPPEALKKGDHWACFTNKGLGKYSIHFSEKTQDVSTGIITIERLISESFAKEGSLKNALF